MTHHGGILISITPLAIAKAFGFTDMFPFAIYGEAHLNK
jgi:hypothetical protein